MPLSNTQEDLHVNCFKKLQRDIINGTYAPGEKLSTSKLTEALLVGQSPIREALSRLVAQELVQLEENKGFRVSPISEKDLNDVYRSTAQISCIAIKQAIELGTDKWEVNLVAVFHQLSIINAKKPSMMPQSLDICYAFNRALIEGCQSPTLIYLTDLLIIRLLRYAKLAVKWGSIPPEFFYEKKKPLVQAVLSRDGEEASRLFVENLMGTFPYIFQSLKKGGLI